MLVASANCRGLHRKVELLILLFFPASDAPEPEVEPSAAYDNTSQDAEDDNEDLDVEQSGCHHCELRGALRPLC